MSGVPPVTLLGKESSASYVPPSILEERSIVEERPVVEERSVLSEQRVEAFKPIVPEHFVSPPVSPEPLSIPTDASSSFSAAPLPAPDMSQAKVDELTDRIEKLEKALAESEKKLQDERKRATPPPAMSAPSSTDQPAPSTDSPPPTTVEKPVAPKPLPAFAIAGVAVSSDKEKIRIEVADSALFVPGTWELNAEAETTLRKIVGEIRANYPNAVLDIEGHTDNLEIDPANKTQRHDVASHKTMLIMQYFVQTLRWDASKITTTSFGPSRPVAENSTPEGRARNNRIEIVVSP